MKSFLLIISLSILFNIQTNAQRTKQGDGRGQESGRIDRIDRKQDRQKPTNNPQRIIKKEDKKPAIKTPRRPPKKIIVPQFMLKRKHTVQKKLQSVVEL